MCYGQILEQGLRRARKLHRCDVCDGLIAPGEIYERQVSVETGEKPGQWRCHARCYAMLNAVDAWGHDGCLYDGRESQREGAKTYGWRVLLAKTRAALAVMMERRKNR